MIRIAFFLTMPISRNTPIRAMMRELHPEHQQRQHRADPGRRQRRQHRHRMDQALVEHAEDDVDRRRRRRRSASAAGLERLLDAGAVPWKLPRTLVGMPMSASAWRDRLARVAEARAVGEVERDRGRELAVLVVDRGRRRPLENRACRRERHHGWSRVVLTDIAGGGVRAAPGSPTPGDRRAGGGRRGAPPSIRRLDRLAAADHGPRSPARRRRARPRGCACTAAPLPSRRGTG